MADASLNSAGKQASVLASAGVAQTLRADLVLTAAWVATDVVSVVDARRAMLWCAYQPIAAGTDNLAQIRVMLSANDLSTAYGEPPTVATDVWYAPSVSDAVPTATTLTQTVATGETATVDPEWGVHIYYPLALTLGSAANNPTTDRIRMGIPVDVTGARWMYVACKELGDITADQLGTLGIDWSISL